MVPLSVSSQVTITIFVPLAVGAFFTFLSVWLSGRNARSNAERQNDLAAKMKLADFRQAWINQLRDCLADLQARGLMSSHKDDEMLELFRIAAKVCLLMNKGDTHYTTLSNLMDLLIRNADQDSRIKYVRELTPLSQDILKTEWEVLKRDLSYHPPKKDS
jgi:hypothetical protein